MPKSNKAGYWICARCKRDLPLSAYTSKDRRLESQRHESTCRECLRPEARVNSHQRLVRYRIEVLTHYSGGPPKCSCCGETEYFFLTFDHIKGGGSKHRKDTTGVGSKNLCAWLKRNNFPEGFRVLCFNCNCGRHRNGGVCPHEVRRLAGVAAD